MKALFILIGLIYMITACTPPSDNTAASIEVVKKYLAAVDNNDYSAMESILADDYLGLGPSIDDSTNKEQALASWKWNAENLYESVNYERTQTFGSSIKEGPGAGDWAYNWTRVSITYKDGSGPVDLRMNAVYKIENGKQNNPDGLAQYLIYKS